MNITAKITIESFLIRANSVHNNKFTYNLSTFNGSGSYIGVMCNDHGLFEQRVDKHLSGSGCSQCANNNLIGLVNNKLFINKPELKDIPVTLYLLNVYDYANNESFLKIVLLLLI